ncbi:hypothetical protein HY633_04150 [Candidatus Uhrbacteria bacterium]|nr:hypothetical protein [Candidatus Uhrbacteria bacterium]
MASTEMIVVSNANAGLNTRRAKVRQLARQVLNARQRVYETKSLEHLRVVARQIHGLRPDTVTIEGGDGTIHQTVSAILQRYETTPGAALPKFVIAPLGTMNNIATSLGLHRRDVVEMEEIILAKCKAGAPFDEVHGHCLKVNGEYGFIYGAGLPVNFLERYYAQRPNLGPTAALRVIRDAILNEAWSMARLRKSSELLTKPVHGRIRLPDGHDPIVGPYMSHTAIMAATVDQVGLGCRALPGAMTVPGCFMLRSSRLNFWGYVAGLLNLWLGLSFPLIFDAIVPRVEIDFEEPTVRQLDGDLLSPAERDVIEIGPRLTFIAG